MFSWGEGYEPPTIREVVPKDCVLTPCWQNKHYNCPEFVKSQDPAVQSDDVHRCLCTCHLVYYVIARKEKRNPDTT